VNDTKHYPPAEFLADFDAVQRFRDAPVAPGTQGFQRVKLLFSMRYKDDPVRFAYRFNRFLCVIVAIESEFPALVQDKIAFRGGKMDKGDDWLPEKFPLALHEWYCSLTDWQMQRMPRPNWPQVMAIYDRLSKAP
jgi:hypothetical protein